MTTAYAYTAVRSAAGARTPIAMRDRFARDATSWSATARRLTLAGTGFLPVTLIAATTFGCDLRLVAFGVLAPAVAIQVALHQVRRDSIAVRRALLRGIVATALYDSFRFAFLLAGAVPRDPIPHIGVALHLHPAWIFGYLWRYAGNGGGLAVAFVALGLRGVRAGVAFGLLICTGLLAVLIVSPYGQQMLFPLNPATVAMAIGGHVIYGAVLGHLTNANQPPARAVRFSCDGDRDDNRSHNSPAANR